MLANSIYSGVPSHFFGMEQVIEVGPMSGKSNVQFWLERHKLPVNDEMVDRIFQRAKESNRTLTDAEIMDCVNAVNGVQSGWRRRSPLVCHIYGIVRKWHYEARFCTYHGRYPGSSLSEAQRAGRGARRVRSRTRLVWGQKRAS
jgi:hypothetical protein